TLALLFSLIIAPHFWFFLIIVFLLQKSKLAWSKDLNALSIFIFSFLITLLEWFIPSQFPGHLGHTWLILRPYLGLVVWGGVPAFSFFSYWLCFWIVAKLQKKKVDYLPVVGFTLFLFLNLAIPLQKEPLNGRLLNIRMIQGNVGNYFKVNLEQQGGSALKEILSDFERITLKNKENKPQLIIYPETVFPDELSSEKLKNNTMPVPFFFQKITDETQADIFFGGYDQVPYSPLQHFEDFYNAGFFLKAGQLQNVYHKRILIPFGETLPLGPLNKYLAPYVSNISYFAQGNVFPLFETSGHFSFISIICYEALFSSFVRDYLQSVASPPDFIINLTNDSWYGDTAEPRQHLFLAKWRALEFAKPLLRSTNTGISSVIYPDGSESTQLALNTQGALDVTLKLSTAHTTFFQRFGIGALVLLWLILLFLIFIKNQVKKSEKP
ncbi:MAG: apolipoprotein N-acyltransferase, partial [Bacteriovoracaceae bacterium]|nr:apolipoprotein N-acyltransferase [Bacteriovoracaceae bacterium]